MSLTPDTISQALARIVDSNTGKDLISSRSARNIRIEAAGSAGSDGGSDVSVDVELGYPARTQIAPIRRQVYRSRAKPARGC